MERDKAKWGAAEWQAYALSLEAAHQAALDGWGATVSELETHSDTIRKQGEIIEVYANLSKTFAAAFAVVTDNQAHDKKRKRGAPRKGYGQLLLALVEGEKPAFVAAYPSIRASDPAVLRWYFKNAFNEQGLRTQRVDSADFRKKLKTMCNTISNARADAKKEAKRKFQLPVK